MRPSDEQLSQQLAIDECILRLKQARAALWWGDAAPKTLARVRAALKSAEGAARHAAHHDLRAARHKASGRHVRLGGRIGDAAPPTDVSPPVVR
jgi:hypothetical protein